MSDDGVMNQLGCQQNWWGKHYDYHCNHLKHLEWHFWQESRVPDPASPSCLHNPSAEELESHNHYYTAGTAPWIRPSQARLATADHIRTASATTMQTAGANSDTAVVIGSGLAGLAAAQALSEHFSRVLVLERDAETSLHADETALEVMGEADIRPGVDQVGCCCCCMGRQVTRTGWCSCSKARAVHPKARVLKPHTLALAALLGAV